LIFHTVLNLYSNINIKVNTIMEECYNELPIETWLQVIPQIIARIHSSVPNLRSNLHRLLIKLGEEHPQALVYSLTGITIFHSSNIVVASQSQSSIRKNAAKSIMNKISEHSENLVANAKLVTRELIRIVNLW